MRLGLISSFKRLTKIGKDFLLKNEGHNIKNTYNYSIYIPVSWCVDQGTIQPSENTHRVSRTDSMTARLMDGDDGKSSLERTDAMATASPIKDVTQHPSWVSEAPHPSWLHRLKGE